MPYTTGAEVRKALASSGSMSESTAASLTNDDIQGTIDEATSEIDGRVPGAPFDDPAPAIVATVAQDVAAYLSLLIYRKGNPVPERHPVQLRYDRARTLLDKMEAGKIDLTTDEEASEPVAINVYEGDLFVLSDFGLGPATTRRDLG